jgi:ERCC4-type nuclease
MTITFFVDSNEAMQSPKVILDIKKAFVGCQVQVMQLQAGDINVLVDEKFLCIERKAPGDFLASIGDGRLFNQTERMVTITPWSFILIDGSISYDMDDHAIYDRQSTNWNGAAVRAAMIAVQLAGCVLMQVGGVAFGFMLRQIIDLAMKPNHEQKLRTMRAISYPPIEPCAEVLASFPGVGLKRARSLLEWVGLPDSDTPQGRLCDAMEWATMFPLLAEGSHPEGWGTVTIANFRGMLGLNSDEYIKVVKEEQNGKTTES